MNKRLLQLSFKATGCTDVGGRKNNEDAYLIDESAGLFVVCDGLGGCDKGEVASRFAVDEIRRVIDLLSVTDEDTLSTLDHDFPTSQSQITSETQLEAAILSINYQLWQENTKTIGDIRSDNPVAMKLAQKKMMGTTMVSLFFQGNRAYVTSIGDSRVYRIVKDSVQQLTHDHSWVEERVREGVLTEEEAKVHAKRHMVTRTLGGKPSVAVDIESLQVYPGDRFLLCSDGLSNVVDEAGLVECATQIDLTHACRELIRLAKDNDARDNITAVLVEVAGECEVDVVEDNLPPRPDDTLI
ncbi:MAG: serine/threonine-protein phosphatase [Deltaproteobacteria bacterium]|nr:serine/threonine-protein phosphatase [Deltaproteobacteria bacterium]